MKIGQNLKRIRKQRNMTLQQVAEKVGCDYALIRKYETGDRNARYDRLSEIAEALDVHPDTLAYADFKGPRAMHWLFLLFSTYEGQLKLEEDENGKKHYFLELPRLILMKEWYEMNENYHIGLESANRIEDPQKRADEIQAINDDYQKWMDRFPTADISSSRLADQSQIDFLLSTLWGDNKMDAIQEIRDMLDRLENT